MENEITYYSFLSHLKAFLKDLLTDPINCKVDEYFYGINLNKHKLLNLLKRRDIIRTEEKIDDSIANKPIFKIKYLIPKKNFERKVKRLYSKLFEINLPPKNNIHEDGEGGDLCGATSAAAVNDSAPIEPIGLNRRKIYITPMQLNKLQEALTTFNAGNYQYDTPFIFNNKDDETYIHNKKGGISVERLD